MQRRLRSLGGPQDFLRVLFSWILGFLSRCDLPVMPPAAAGNPPAPKILPLLRTLTVRNVEVTRIADIDILSQRFHAEVVVQLAFEGGAHDEHLSNPDDSFPLDSLGRPTFRPSAAWYMKQVDFNNAIEYKTLDAKILKDGDDLLMNMRFEGTFSEISKWFTTILLHS